MQCSFSAFPEKMRQGTFVSALHKRHEKSPKLINQANLAMLNCFMVEFENMPPDSPHWRLNIDTNEKA